MRHKVIEKVQEQPVENRCHHYWVIETANGPQSRGVCKFCGEVKYFHNTMPNFNAMKRGGNPLNLPKINDVKMDGESSS